MQPRREEINSIKTVSEYAAAASIITKKKKKKSEKESNRKL